MRFAIYTRVSTDEQTTENQVIRLKAYAESNNWDYDIYEEVMSSRKTRPIKQKVLTALRHREYDGILIYKIDRWARSSIELMTEFKELYDKKIIIVSVSDNIDLTTSTGQLQFQILGAFAEFERNIIRERTLEGLARAKAQGKTLGRPKGAKDKNYRKKSGYWLRHSNNKSKKETKTYFCPKCNKNHSKKSKLGVKHQKHRANIPPL